jgi:excisionase family DNA binding protein
MTQPADQQSTDLYTVLEIAGRMRVSKHTVYRAISSGELDWVDIGNDGKARIRVSEDQYAAYLKKRRRTRTGKSRRAA